MTWEVEFTDEFEIWWDALTGEEQESIAASVGLLETVGPNLKLRTAVELMAHSISKSSVHFVGFASRTSVLSPSSPSRSRMI